MIDSRSKTMRLMRKSSLLSLPANRGMDRITIEIKVRNDNFVVLRVFIIFYLVIISLFPQEQNLIRELVSEPLFYRNRYDDNKDIISILVYKGSINSLCWLRRTIGLEIILRDEGREAALF